MDFILKDKHLSTLLWEMKIKFRNNKYKNKILIYNQYQKVILNLQCLQTWKKIKMNFNFWNNKKWFNLLNFKKKWSNCKLRNNNYNKNSKFLKTKPPIITIIQMIKSKVIIKMDIYKFSKNKIK
jgi:hypothetical protein